VNAQTQLQIQGLTLEQASTVSGIGRTKLYEAIGNGKLTARKFGKRTIILRNDLLNFLAALPEVQ
jgi:excisionase family DNA binding protein